MHALPSPVPTSRFSFPARSSTSDPMTLERLFASQPAEKLCAGAAAFWEGDPASHLFQLVEGCLRLYRVFADGRRAVIGFRFAGETFGISCPSTYAYTAEAVTPVRLRRISRNRLHALAEERVVGVQSLLMSEMLDEMKAAQRHIIVLGQLGAEERVKDFLISVALRTNVELERSALIELPMTRLDIADYLGLTIETVCRAMSKLKRNGTITLQGRHKIILRRIDEMRDMAGSIDAFRDVADEAALAKLPN